MIHCTDDCGDHLFCDLVTLRTVHPLGRPPIICSLFLEGKSMKKELIVSTHRQGSMSGGTQAVRVGQHVLVSGVMPLDARGQVIGADMTTQARVVFDKLKSVLAEAGTSLADVVKHNVYFYCDDDDAACGQLIDDLNRVRLDYFSEPGPTTTETRVGLDVEGALLLVDAWAIVDAHKQRLMPANHWQWNSQSPFSHGWRVGDMIFIGGQRSLDREGRVIGEGDIEVQTDNAFRNLDTMLKAAGGDQTNLMRQNTYYRFIGEGQM